MNVNSMNLMKKFGRNVNSEHIDVYPKTESQNSVTMTKLQVVFLQRFRIHLICLIRFDIFFLTASHRARSLPFQPSTHISDHKFSSKIKIHTIKTGSFSFSFFILTHFCSIFLNHTTAVIFPWHYHAPGLPRQTGSLT